MDVKFVVGVANIAVTLAFDVVCVIWVCVFFVVDIKKGMTVDVTFIVVAYAVGTVVVGAVALVGGVTIVDKVALGSTLVVVHGVRLFLESVAVSILAVVALAVTELTVDTFGLVTVGPAATFTEFKLVDFNDVEPEVTMLLPANKTICNMYYLM